jgi:hypothetical protein
MSRARNIANLVGGSVPALTRKYYDVVNAATSNKAEFTSIPSTAKRIVVDFVDVGTDVANDLGALAFLVSVGGSYINTGYDGHGYYHGAGTGSESRTATGAGVGDNVRPFYWTSADNRRTDGSFVVDLIDATNYIYKINLFGHVILNGDDHANSSYSGVSSFAFIDLNGPIDKVKIELDGAGAIDHGSAVAYYEV